MIAPVAIEGLHAGVDTEENVPLVDENKRSVIQVIVKQEEGQKRLKRDKCGVSPSLNKKTVLAAATDFRPVSGLSNVGTKVGEQWSQERVDSSVVVV